MKMKRSALALGRWAGAGLARPWMFHDTMSSLMFF